MEKNDNVLPKDFDGIFRFTNFRDEEFKAKWDNIEYTFPAKSTTPMIISGASPEQVQHIRKKFAKELAVVEFYESKKFKQLNKHVEGGTPALYNESDIASFVQRCLEPLPLGQIKMKALPRDDESKYTKDEKGRNRTKVLDKDDSLKSGSGDII